MLSTFLFPLGFNKVSTDIQEVKVAKGISSKLQYQTKLQTSSKDNASTTRWRKDTYVQHSLLPIDPGFRLSHRLTRGIVAKANQQKIFQCWSSTSEPPSREESTDQHNLSNYMNRLKEREVCTVHRLNTDQFSDENQISPPPLPVIWSHTPPWTKQASEKNFKIPPNRRDFDIFQWDGENTFHTSLERHKTLPRPYYYYYYYWTKYPLRNEPLPSSVIRKLLLKSKKSVVSQGEGNERLHTFV